MFTIDIPKLEPGDIILIRSSSHESVLIRTRGHCDYSHAILYVGVSSCIESNGDGVQSFNPQRMLVEKKDDAVVLRIKSQNAKNAIRKVVEFARRKIGTEYSTFEAKLSTHTNTNKAKEVNRQFCTRFVAQAYEQAGLKIVQNPDYCSTQELLNSISLKQVDDVVRDATPADIILGSETSNIIELQREILHNILESFRNISGEDIQTFEQLNIYVLNNPLKESEIVKVIKDSGFLNLWELEYTDNPWFYDYSVAIDFFTDPIYRRDIGVFLTTNEKEIRIRFETSLITVKLGYSQKQQEYFRLFIDLYNKLIGLSKLRELIGLLLLRG